MLARPRKHVPDIWTALGDPTRRDLVDRLAGGPLSTTALGAGVPMSRFGVMKHIAVLERAGLVTSRKHGRVRLHHLNRAPLAELYERWLTPRAAAWGVAVSALARHTEGEPMPDTKPAGSAIAEIALDWTIGAPVESVWNTMCAHVDAWWPAAHRAGLDGARMALDPRAGGALTESNAAGAAVEWYRVYAMDPRRSLDLVGHLASRYGGPGTSFVHISLEPVDDGRGTLLKLTDSVVGRAGPQLGVSIAEGWRAIIGAGLVAHLSAAR